MLHVAFSLLLIYSVTEYQDGGKAPPAAAVVCRLAEECLLKMLVGEAASGHFILREILHTVQLLNLLGLAHNFMVACTSSSESHEGSKTNTVATEAKMLWDGKKMSQCFGGTEELISMFLNVAGEAVVRAVEVRTYCTYRSQVK